MRKICVLLLAVVFAATSRAQEIKKIDVIITPSLREVGEIPYSKTPLTWNNFKGAPDNSCDFIAMTYSGIKIKFEYKTRKGITEAKVLLCPYMDVNQSWYKEEGHNDPTLAHEQRHFDITALVTSQFAEEIKKRNFSLETLSAELKLLHKHYTQKIADLQKQYDDETAHGTIPEQQAVWDKKITEQVIKAFAQG